jgi:hypothetical protein
VIHVIDTVLLPPTNKTASANTSAGSKSDSARKLIELAIAHGVPMYNDGDAKGCAAIYEVAAHGLLALGAENMCPTSRERMSTKLASATRMHNARQKAWMLRGILDHAHASLTSDSE